MCESDSVTEGAVQNCYCLYIQFRWPKIELNSSLVNKLLGTKYTKVIRCTKVMHKI